MRKISKATGRTKAGGEWRAVANDVASPGPGPPAAAITREKSDQEHHRAEGQLRPDEGPVP